MAEAGDIEVVGGRTRWVRARGQGTYVSRRAVEGVRYECPCCRYPTLRERDAFEICSLCSWEDDGQDDFNADEVKGGPNSDYSLTEARTLFTEHLSIWRPDDLPGFARETSERLLSVKRRMIAAFDEMRASPTLERLDELWESIDIDVLLLSWVRYRR